MKKRIIGATFLAVVVALVISNLVGIWVFRMREIDAARQNLEELLILMDAQSAITDPQGVTDQFRQAAPDKRLTIIDTDGAVLGGGHPALRYHRGDHVLRGKGLCRRHGGPGLHAAVLH